LRRCDGATQLIENFNEAEGTFDIAPGFFSAAQRPDASTAYCPFFGAGGPLQGTADAGFVASDDKERTVRTPPLTPGAFEVDCL
jgi:hypothetical protein